MLKKKCFNCDKKIERKFHFCPWCGVDLKMKNPEDYGMLGMDDGERQQDILNSMPLFGGPLAGMINNLTKQLSKELQNLDLGENQPKNVQIKVYGGIPVQKTPKVAKDDVIFSVELNEKEKKRRSKLPIVDAESKLRRLPEGIIYEINAPGVKDKQDISISRIENGLEIRAYSENKCYVKTIPIKTDALKFVVRDDKVFLRINN